MDPDLSARPRPINAESYVESIGDVKIEKYAILKKITAKNRYFLPFTRPRAEIGVQTALDNQVSQ